tara:strand:- start:46660 stop:46875 length:216 start_codon:yes stop_codon:yes gene_type:complete
MPETISEQFKNLCYTLFKRNLCIELDREMKKNFLNKSGVEIGGPSNFFKRNYPLHQIIARLDIVNFSEETL